MATGIAIVGCGFVADLYMATSRHHPELRVVGCHDRDPHRLAAFAAHHRLAAYRHADDLLRDPAVEIVLNLTNPRAHFELTRSCLHAGKHVYSEKPLAMTSDDAGELVRIARERNLQLAAAPCSLLGETAQTLWKGVRDGRVGRVRVVYASFDDGMIHRLDPTRWRSASGAPWPARDEFEVGCTFEHAGYVLSWLAAFFGPARRVHAYASCLVPDKGIPVEAMAPDFSVGCVEYDGGVVARVTCSIVAPVDKSISIVGDEGVLYTKYVRDDASPVFFRKTRPNRVLAGLGARLKRVQHGIEDALHLPCSFGWPERRIPFARPPTRHASSHAKPVDFLRGPSELAQAIRDGRPCRLSPELAQHMVELVETLQHPERFPPTRTIRSTFAPIEPLA